MSQMNLKEPEQLAWDKYEAGGKYVAPPPALGADGKPIVYYGTIPVLPAEAFGADKDGNRQWVIDPITVVKSAGGVHDGYKLRFTRVSTKLFVGKDGKAKNASSVGNLFRSVKLTAKPQKNAEYDAAVRQTAGRTAAFTIDWEARDKDSGEEVRGYANFPDDPDRPGLKKSILKAGDVFIGKDGTPQTVTAPVLFANARVKYFRDGQ